MELMQYRSAKSIKMVGNYPNQLLKIMKIQV